MAVKITEEVYINLREIMLGSFYLYLLFIYIYCDDMINLLNKREDDVSSVNVSYCIIGSRTTFWPPCIVDDVVS